MKPVQDIQKPEKKDWVKRFGILTWKVPNSACDEVYFILKSGVDYLACYNPSIHAIEGDDTISSHGSLDAAQEACWQHYLKTRGAESEW